MRTLKIILAWPICWSLFWIGHVASIVIHYWPDNDHDDEPSLAFKAVFQTYQRTMGTSHRIQVWAEGEDRYCDYLPWGPPVHD